MLINESFDFPFSLLSSAGALINADSTPTGTVRKNGATVAGASITITSLSTGEYRAIVLFASGDGWVIGDSWTFRVAYAIAGIAQSLSWSGKIRGDAYSRIGAGGAGLTAIADARLANLDAAISSRSTYNGADTAGTTSLLSRLTGARATALDFLDIAVSSRSSHSALDTWNVSQNAAFTPNTLGVKFKNWVLGSDNRALVSADAHTAGVTVAGVTANVNTNANATETAIKAKTDNLPTSPAATGDAMTLTLAERNATATILEGRLLNDGDGQALINAIVAAIGNSNLDQAVVVAAIRADIERSGGALATILFDYARRTGDYATPSDVQITPDVIVEGGFTDDDRTDLSAIKTVTDALPGRITGVVAL